MDEQTNRDDTTGGGGDPGRGGGEEKQNARERISEGFSRGIGVLSAFKEALEQTIDEARERGDLSVDRARDAMKDAMDRARDATADARERFDFVSSQEFDALEKRVRELEARLGIIRPGGSGESGPEGKDP